MKEVHTYNMIGNSIDVANKEMEGLRIGQNQETKESLETHEASLKEGKVADCNEAQDGDVEGDYPSQDGAPAAKKKKKKSKSKKKNGPLQQTDPPSIPVDELFPSGEFPEGEIQRYKDD
ncbi:methionine aminopeptidase 2A-like isoform X2 [Oryza brachyantha]|uniref:methionine aminopeptidase 2A-like isoform X2 n=1 Tax=Oryza brachyantha TaxID=4533 RepID=UPI0007762405|nr:methionine aminopeptidase 2A-like isoform X2 [Oryza brachyantha]